MHFLLTEKVLNRGCAAHIADHLGCGADYRAYYAPLYAPFDAKIFLFSETGGGDWIRFIRADGYRVETAHLSKRLVTTGQTVKEGQHVGVTGNTGVITTGPHLHVQVFDPQGRRVDPEQFFKDSPLAKNIMNEDIEGFAIIQNPGGVKGFFKGGKNHLFEMGSDGKQKPFASAYDQYSFIKLAKFIPKDRFDSLPKGTLTAEQVLLGKRDL